MLTRKDFDSCEDKSQQTFITLNELIEITG